MFNLKNLKVVKEIKNLQPKLKWLMFSEVEDYKLNSDYFDMICGTKENNVEATELYLERMVRESLVKEYQFLIIILVKIFLLILTNRYL